MVMVDGLLKVQDHQSLISNWIIHNSWTWYQLDDQCVHVHAYQRWRLPICIHIYGLLRHSVNSVCLVHTHELLYVCSVLCVSSWQRPSGSKVQERLYMREQQHDPSLLCYKTCDRTTVDQYSYAQNMHDRSPHHSLSSLLAQNRGQLGGASNPDQQVHGETYSTLHTQTCTHTMGTAPSWLHMV